MLKSNVKGGNEAVSSTGNASKSRSLKAILTTLTMGACLVPLGLFSLNSYTDTTRQVQEKVEGQLLSSNQASSKIVTTWIDGNVALIQGLASQPDFSEMDLARIKPVLESTNKHVPTLYTLNLMDTKGMQVTRSSADKLISVADRKYFTQIMNDNKPFTLESGVSRANNQPFIAFSAPAKKDGQTVGVLAGLATVKNITDQATGGKIGKEGFSYLIDNSSSTILAHPNVKRVGEKLKDDELSRIKGASKGAILKAETSAGEIHYVVNPLTETLALVSEISTEEINEPIRAAQQTAIAYSVLALLVSGLLAFFLASSLSKKIERLSAVMNAISRAKSVHEIEKLEYHVGQIGGAREITTIASSVLRLTSSIKLALSN